MCYQQYEDPLSRSERIRSNAVDQAMVRYGPNQPAPTLEAILADAKLIAELVADPPPTASQEPAWKWPGWDQIIAVRSRLTDLVTDPYAITLAADDPPGLPPALGVAVSDLAGVLRTLDELLATREPPF